MISKLFRSKVAPSAPSAPRVPHGVVAWAIGDIHGRLDLLRPLVAAIRADLARGEAERKLVIFLGDYIDRGPESRQVVDYLAELARSPDAEWRFLRGNHEQTMLDFMRDPGLGPQWCEYGGEQTLQSYGLRPPAMKHRTETWGPVAADLAHRVSPEAMTFLEGLENSVTVGDYFFAHAGARPKVPLERQTPNDLMWIRSQFLDSPVGFERIVVHGHTPTSEVHADSRRIGIDTRAYSSGRLTALRLIGPDRLLMQSIGKPGGRRGGEVAVEPLIRTEPLTPAAAAV